MSYTPERPQGIHSEAVTRACPDCGTVNPRSARSCWLCYARFRDGDEVYEAQPLPSEANARKSVTAWTTFALLCGLVLLAGAGMMDSGETSLIVFGSLFVAVTIPILAQIARAASEAGRGSSGLSFGRTVSAILMGMGIAFVIVLATEVMFVVTCLPIGLATFKLHHGGGDNGLDYRSCRRHDRRRGHGVLSDVGLLSSKAVVVCFPAESVNAG